jgi:hypothetical protein
MPAGIVAANPGSSELTFAAPSRTEDRVDKGEAKASSRVRGADGSLPMLGAATCGLGVPWAGTSVVGCATGCSAGIGWGACPTGAAGVGATGWLLGAGWAGWWAGAGAAGGGSTGVVGWGACPAGAGATGSAGVGWGACSAGTGAVGGTGCWPGAISWPGGLAPGCCPGGT